MISLQARLLIAAVVVLTVFLTITGVILDRAFSKHAINAAWDRLRGHSYSIYQASLNAGSQLPEDVVQKKIPPSDVVVKADPETDGSADGDEEVTDTETEKPAADQAGKKDNSTTAGAGGNEPAKEVKPQGIGDVGEPVVLSDFAFNESRSGLYYRILHKARNKVWESNSLRLAPVPFGKAKPGEFRVSPAETVNGEKYFLIAFTFAGTGSSVYTFQYSEPLNKQKESEWHARIIDSRQQVKWDSRGSRAVSIPFNDRIKIGGYRQRIMHDESGRRYFTLSYAVLLENEINGRKRESQVIYQVTEAFDKVFDKQVAEIRDKLVRWLTALSITLLISLIVILRWWGLGPLRKVSAELDDVQAGNADNLSGPYPQELVSLTDSIKTLVVSERAQQERYRNSLGDLAHSLKTPLAVLSGVTDGKETDTEEVAKNIHEQVQRMRQIVDYQLQRAAASGRSTLLTPVPVKEVVDSIVRTLDKAYHDKQVSCHVDIGDDVSFTGDKGDLMEMSGNIMENAYKLCQGQVQITVTALPEQDKGSIRLVIEDDGPGIPDDKIETVLKRGFRADQTTSGQGIGLAVVKEIVFAYDGTIAIDRSPLGGARFTVCL